MKAYVITTGSLFALLVLVHVWRAFEEGAQLAARPEYIGVTALAAAMCFWAWRVFRSIRS
jgi:EamA domain-containing membrane protein RarD